MSNIKIWRSLGLKACLLTVAIALVGLTAWQVSAADWSHSSKDTKGAFIGIYPEDIDSEDREALEFKGEGILVEDVVDDGPAQKAGLKAGDIIVKIDSENITNSSTFREILAKHSPGDKITVVTVRKGETKDVVVELAEKETKEYSFNFKHGEKEKRGFLGVVTETIEGDFAKYFGVEEGALIKKVVEDSPAEKAGLKAGDVLTEIAGDEIEETDDVSEAVREHKPGDQVKVKYFRDKKETTLDIKLAEAPGSSWKMTKPDGHRIIISNDEEIVVDTDELNEAIREVMEELRIGIDESKSDLKHEVEQLKVEIEQLKKEMEKKKNEK